MRGYTCPTAGTIRAKSKTLAVNSGPTGIVWVRKTIRNNAEAAGPFGVDV